MCKNRLLGPALAGFLTLTAAHACATTFTEPFTTDPQQDGWRIFGDTNLFQWNATNHDLRVTWDSTQPNSFFYHRLGTILTRADSFSLQFDLRLTDIASGTEPGKTGGLEIAFGFQNLANVTRTNFSRASATNLVELDYFPPGYFAGYGPVAATTSPTCISTNGTYATLQFLPYAVELPTNVLIHVAMTYTATNQTLAASITTNGIPIASLPSVVLNDPSSSAFGSNDDFRLDTFCISSYSSTGDNYDSVLAHGIVDNLVVTVPPPPIQHLIGAYTNRTWQVRFTGRTNWLYTLERTTNWSSWTAVPPETAGVDGTLKLSDPNPPPGAAYYRVRANRP